MENLKKLVHQRGQVKARVTTIVGKLNEATEHPETTSLSQLKALEKKLELHYAEYSSKHDSIMSQCPTESIDDQDRKLDEFDELHTDALVKLNQLVDFFRAEPANNRAPQYMNHLREQFWAKWSRDYLSSLQSRAKWTKSEPNVKLGTIVLMMEENQAVQSWRLGRIAALHPGQDGVVRVADVKTAAGIFRRSIRKLAPLPIEDTDEPSFGMTFQPAGACTRLTRASENVTSPTSPSI
nr:uncharacterized protein LOC115265164 [Aedes albopictus]